MAQPRPGFHPKLFQARMLHLFFLGRDIDDKDFQNGCRDLRMMVGINDLLILMNKIPDDPNIHQDDYMEMLEMVTGQERAEQTDDY
jgi:hypothetical protein